tara:strand:- start:6709 stop:7107 length:399 start_codon:yes stop_codon:yes gene_type:complete
MATTTAVITLSSSDLTGDSLALTKSATLTQAGTLDGLEYTSGIAKKKLAVALTDYTLFDDADYTVGTANKIYIFCASKTESEFITLKIGTVEIGTLYAGDWTLLPWTATAGIDVTVAPSVAAMKVEYMIINE